MITRIPLYNYLPDEELNDKKIELKTRAQFFSYVDIGKTGKKLISYFSDQLFCVRIDVGQ